GLLRESGLKRGRVVQRNDGEPGSREGERSTQDAVIKWRDVSAPEYACRKGRVECRKSRRDLRFQDRRIVNRLESARTQGAGNPSRGPRIERRRLEAADRDALRAKGDHAHGLGVV